MGNCQDLLMHNEVRPHKVPDRRRKGMMNSSQASGTTMPMSMWSLATEMDKSVNTACMRDVSSKSTTTTSSTLQPLRPTTMTPRPQPQLSKDTLLRLMAAEEEELGCIRYEYSCLEDSTTEAKVSQKPILCIQVHVPGNVRIGREILSHPLIVEAAETLFVPVQCRQEQVSVNVADLISYTSLRIMNDSGVDIVKPIQEKSLSVGSVASSMTRALDACNLRVPTYLALLEEEHSGKRWQGPSNCLQRTDRQAVFGMKCPKRGEVEFAAMSGVLSTRAGYYQGNHVVQVTYDTTRLSYCRLVRCALQRSVVNVIYYQSNEERIVGTVERQRLNQVETDIAFHQECLHKSVDPKPALQTTMLRFVPLTDLQSTRANRLVSMGSFNEAMHLLSPRQGQIMMRACQDPHTPRKNVVDVEITSAWKSLSENPKPVQTSQ